MRWKLVYMLLCVAALIGCNHSNEPEVQTDSNKWTGAYTDTMIYEGLLPIDTCYVGLEGEVDYQEGRLYLCSHSLTNVYATDTAKLNDDYSPWRIPTRQEATILNGIDIGDTEEVRYICLDTDGTPYTFRFGTGKVTKAGQKTKYKIRPIRTQYTNDSIIIYL